MIKGINLTRARSWIRHGVWWVDCAAAAVGWTFVLLLALSGFSMLIAGYLIGDFFTHYVSATEEARASFHWFAVPFVLSVFAVTCWMRWSTRALLAQKGEGGNV